MTRKILSFGVHPSNIPIRACGNYEDAMSYRKHMSISERNTQVLRGL